MPAKEMEDSLEVIFFLTKAGPGAFDIDFS